MKKLLYIFSFLILLSSIIFAEDACPDNDVSVTFDSNVVAYNVSHSLDTDASRYYYFDSTVPGTITLTFTSPAGKAEMGYSLTSCPIPVTGNTSEIKFNLTASDLDFNLAVTGTTNGASYSIDIDFEPAPLSITKTVFPAQIEENTDNTITYTIDITNDTSSPLTNLIMTDNLPFDPADLLSPVSVNNGSWTCNISSSTLVECNLASLAGGGTAPIDIVVELNAAADDIENIASVKADGTSTYDASAMLNIINADRTVNLKVEKFAQADLIPTETNFQYAIFVSNTGNTDAYGVSITDNFPEDDINITGYDTSTGWTCPDVTDPTTTNPFTCTYNSTLEKQTIAILVLHAKTGDHNATNARNTVTTVDALNAVNVDVESKLFADINITTDQNVTSGASLGGSYSPGGNIEVSDKDISESNPIITRDNARIYTKVALRDYVESSIEPHVDKTLSAYFLNGIGDNASNTPYTDDIPLTVILKLADDSCNEASSTYLDETEAPVTAQFDGKNPGQAVSSVGNFLMRNIAMKKARLIMKYIDINDEVNASGESCSNSNLSSNLAGIPQCFNSGGSTKLDNNKFLNVFGVDAYMRCVIGSGNPCSSENHGYSCGDGSVDCLGYDDTYDHEYGCYECILGGIGYCSQDNFAIRPKAFDVNISNGDIYKAGKDYRFAFKGLTEITAEVTRDYNETQRPKDTDGTFYVDLNVSNNSECEVKDLNISPNVHFQNGLHEDDFRFSDIGDINMSIHETNGTEFAIVDNAEDDTPDEEHRLISKYDVNFTVIPHHFDINATLYDHNTADNFTYIHDINRYDGDDNYTMSAVLTMDIKAMGADDNITHNYTEQCYAKDTSLTLDINDTNITYPGSVPALTQFLYYNPIENNGTADIGEGAYDFPTTSSPITITSLPIDNIPSSFPNDAPEGNGTTHIEYKLNFDRKQNLVVNPFKIILSDVNITEVDASITDPDNLVKGDTGTLSDQNATMYYARSRASKFFYEDIIEATVVTPILVDIYCDLGFSACDTLDIDTVNGAIKDYNPKWWLSLGHNETTQNDGNITLVIGDIIESNGTANPTVDTDVTVDSDAQDPDITVNSNGSGLPMTVIIDLDNDDPTDTNHWLIFNPKDDTLPPSPFYKVRFISDSNWTGTGDTGDVSNINSSRKKSYRMDW